MNDAHYCELLRDPSEKIFTDLQILFGLPDPPVFFWGYLKEEVYQGEPLQNIDQEEEIISENCQQYMSYGTY